MLNMLVDNDFFTTPSVAVDFNFSGHNIAVRSLMCRVASSFSGRFREAAAPHDAGDNADEADTEYHEEGYGSAPLCFSGCFLTL